ncbi:MAG: sulfotransferase domain-containing protein [Porticoccus sp.]|nr:sulfotransferase domain-containing protein [Porticoccus sp.]
MSNLLGKLIYNKYTASAVNRYYDLKLRKLKSFIFVATTGRSGTLTLVDIFSQLENCVALHEPYPAMHDNILHAAAYGNEKVVEEFYKIRKSVNIRRDAIGKEFYLEANHLFIKTFIKYAIEDFGEKVKVIHLVRNPTNVANSIYALQDQPGTTEGNRWWLDYRAPTNLIAIPDMLDNDPVFKHPYYKALWYWFETESRIALWKKKLPNTPFVFFKTESFNDKDKLSALFTQLDMSVPDSFVENVVNLRSHARSHQKKVPPLPDEQTKEMLHSFLTLLKDNQISIPESSEEYL